MTEGLLQLPKASPSVSLGIAAECSNLNFKKYKRLCLFNSKRSSFDAFSAWLALCTLVDSISASTAFVTIAWNMINAKLLLSADRTPANLTDVLKALLGTSFLKEHLVFWGSESVHIVFIWSAKISFKLRWLHFDVTQNPYLCSPHNFSCAFLIATNVLYSKHTIFSKRFWQIHRWSPVLRRNSSLRTFF